MGAPLTGIMLIIICALKGWVRISFICSFYG